MYKIKNTNRNYSLKLSLKFCERYDRTLQSVGLKLFNVLNSIDQYLNRYFSHYAAWRYSDNILIVCWIILRSQTIF